MTTAASTQKVDPRTDALAQERAFAQSVLWAEARAVEASATRLGPEFHLAVDLLERCAETGGTVLVTGLGKSGLVGAKISATMASLGIPSHAVHPSEAAHGDLGRFRPTDTVIALSYSGETDEVVNLAAVLKQDGIPIVAITRGTALQSGDGGAALESGAARQSSLERLATVTLPICIDGEAGGFEFAAPTCSTTVTLALGDALALALARRRNFSDQDFAKRHPGGALGGLLKPVMEVMRFKAGHNCPLVPQTSTVHDAMHRLEVGRRSGAMLIVDDSGCLVGVFTDGDLRRLILRDPDLLKRPMGEVMTQNPRTLPGTAIVRDAVKLIREYRLDEIPVTDNRGVPLGILDVQDLIAMRLVRD